MINSNIIATNYRCEQLETAGLWADRGRYTIDKNMRLCFPDAESYHKAMEVLKS